jgi:O-antigen ligase
MTAPASELSMKSSSRGPVSPPVSLMEPTHINDLGILGLALLIGIGGFKLIPSVAALPVDATVLAFVLTLAGLAGALLRSGFRVRKAILGPVVLWVSMYPALFFTSFEGDALVKTVLLFGVLFACAIAPMVLFRTVRDIRLFLIFIASQGVILSLGALWVFGAEGTLRAGAFGGSVLHAAQLGGAALLMALSVAFRERPWRLPALLVAGLALIAIVGTGTRAALFGIVLTIIVGLVLSRWTSVTRLQRLALGSVVMLSAWLIAIRIAPGRALGRIEGFVTNPELDLSNLLRVDALRVSFDGALAAPFGRGIDSFGAEWTDNLSPRFYGYHMHHPHNLVAESAIELGWVATVLMLALLALAFIRARDVSAHIVGEITLLLLIYTFLQSLTRGAITDQRLLFAMASCAIVLPQILRSEGQDPRIPPSTRQLGTSGSAPDGATTTAKPARHDRRSP